MRWIWSVYFVLIASSSANWTMPAFTNAQAWGSSITATGTVREHTQVVTQYTTNAPVTWTNFYWRFDAGATSNDYTETDGETYTNLIVDIGIPDRTNTMLLRGRDAAMWELYLAQIERAQVVGDAPTQPSFYWHTDYISNLQARKDWIEANAGNWVCTTNADTNSLSFDAYFQTKLDDDTGPEKWNYTNLLEYAGAPTNWLDYTPTWPAERIVTNTVTLSGTNAVVTNSFWFGNVYTNLTGTNGQIATLVFTNANIDNGYSGIDYQRHDTARKIMDSLFLTWAVGTGSGFRYLGPGLKYYYVSGFHATYAAAKASLATSTPAITTNAIVNYHIETVADLGGSGYSLWSEMSFPTNIGTNTDYYLDTQSTNVSYYADFYIFNSADQNFSYITNEWDGHGIASNFFVRIQTNKFYASEAMPYPTELPSIDFVGAGNPPETEPVSLQPRRTKRGFLATTYSGLLKWQFTYGPTNSP